MAEMSQIARWRDKLIVSATPVTRAYENAGVKASTFRAWHNINQLFAARKENSPISGMDLCILRAVVLLTQSGMSARCAVPIAQGLVAESLSNSWVKGGALVTRVKHSKGAVGIEIDLAAIIEHVARAVRN